MKKRSSLIVPMLALILASMGCYVWGGNSSSGTAGPVVATTGATEAGQTTNAPTTTSENTSQPAATESGTQPTVDLNTITIKMKEITRDVASPVDLQNAGDGSG